MHDILIAMMNNLTGVALVITSITGLVSVWRNGTKAAHIQAEQAKVKVELMAEQEKQNKHLAVIEGKVDGGMSAMQTAIAHIATAAVAANQATAAAAALADSESELDGRRAGDKIKGA
jgi:hypothetical protein